MTTYTENQAARQLDDVLAKADAEGEVRITTAGGKTFAILKIPSSPMSVPGVTLDPPITVDEIISFIHEGRDRDYGIK